MELGSLVGNINMENIKMTLDMLWKSTCEYLWHKVVKSKYPFTPAYSPKIGDGSKLGED